MPFHEAAQSGQHQEENTQVPTRHIIPGLFAGWQITDTEGQHTAPIVASRQDALEHAHHQLAALGGGRVVIDDHGEP